MEIRRVHPIMIKDDFEPIPTMQELQEREEFSRQRAILELMLRFGDLERLLK